MRFTRCVVPDVILIEPEVHGDERGYFVETFRKDKFEEFVGFGINFCQDNESKSKYGVLRGLHYQLPPFAQSKLIRVISGSILDIALDIRIDSPTFGQHVAVKLDSISKHQLFIPRGFAHGFVTLSDEAIFAYKVDNYYSKPHDRGIAFNDTALGIDWLLKSEELILSGKDTMQPTLAVADKFETAKGLYV